MEILAPAGNINTAKLAINYGCDALYLGGKNFGARSQANNFTYEELIEIINYAHTFDVKVYITVNTIIKSKEMDEVINFVRFLNDINVDAIIIQDLGLFEKVHKIFPDLNLHASTQMSVNSIYEAKVLKDLGFKRIIVAREANIELIKDIIDNVDIEIEVFAHGALCMCYSGNCYMSSFIGKRSGNRGRCAQPCRLPYRLSCEKDSKYLLSPKDLNTLDYVKELEKIGVKSIKIEGRMKRSEYVALCVKSYKDALSNNDLTKDKHDLSLMFNRGFTKGYLFNEENANFTNTSSPNHIGLKVGKVLKSTNTHASILLCDDVNDGDSLRFTNDAITINEMYVNGKKEKHAKSKDIIQVRTHEKIIINSDVLKTTDIKLLEDIRKQENKKIPLFAKVYKDNKRLNLLVSDYKYNTIEISDNEVEDAKNPLMKERIESQLRKTSDTNYYFKDVKVLDNMFIPIKDINEIRRKAILHIEEKRLRRNKNKENTYSSEILKVKKTNKIYVKVRTKNQLLQALDVGIEDILVEDSSLLMYKELYPSVNFYLVEARLNQNKNTYDVISTLNNLNEECELSSPYMNILNANSIYFMHKNKVKTVCLSIEASKDDIVNTINDYKLTYNEEPNLAMMVYGYYELMIMKHCLINKALDKKNIGCMMCEMNNYFLEDRLNYHFPLIRDKKCNLKILNSKCLHLLTYIQEIKSLGINNIYLDFTIEENIKDIIISYRNAFLNNDIKYLFIDNVTFGHFKEEIL